jgi:hypothetical protein
METTSHTFFISAVKRGDIYASAVMHPEKDLEILAG